MSAYVHYTWQCPVRMLVRTIATAHASSMMVAAQKRHHTALRHTVCISKNARKYVHKQLEKVKLASGGGNPFSPAPGKFLHPVNNVQAMLERSFESTLLQSVSSGISGEWHCLGAPCDGQTSAAVPRMLEQSPSAVPAGIFAQMPNPIIGGQVQ